MKLITKSLQFAGQFVVINILGKFSGTQKFIVLEGFPTILNRIKGRIEDDAVRMQMRIKRAGGVMSEPGRCEVAC